MKPWKFYIGEKVNIVKGKYSGRNAIIEEQNSNHKGNLYIVKEIQSDVLCALYEDELQSMFEHDIDQLKTWKEILCQN